MDLRGNPAALYEQAQKVSDAFIKAGTLVSMVGVGGAQRKDETATDSGHEPTVPLAVLVNQNSASASEIVAGAVKNLDRGVVIGEGRSARDRCRCCSTSRRRSRSATARRRQAGPEADDRAVPDAG
jgi:hypothetical protein